MQSSTHPPITGHPDTPDQAPWALQLIVRVEKTSPPDRTTAIEAAAIATVHLLHTAACAGQWEHEIAKWRSGRIRKHVRRARGAAWERVQDVPGVTISHRGVQVRALTPTATDTIPVSVAKLQLTGSELPELGNLTPPSHPNTVHIYLSPAPLLPFGKAAAAAGHAAQLAWEQMTASEQDAWALNGFPVHASTPPAPEWVEHFSDRVAIVDAGLTEVAPGTITATANWK